MASMRDKVRGSSAEAAMVADARAFTLIELMVVILIIAVVIAILIPTVGGARTAAKRSATQRLMTNITDAAGQFENDERRLPGYFAERDMGSSYNAQTAGMSSMQNVMLDLIGRPPTSAAPSPNAVKVGPVAATQIDLDCEMFGVSSNGSKQYFTPDPKFYTYQVNGTQQIADITTGHSRAAGDPKQMKSVVDAWGLPLLAWRQDETYTNPVTTRNDFVRPTSDGANGPSRFYWASNACFLEAPAAGNGFNQPLTVTDMANTGAVKGSMIGADGVGATTCSTSGIRSLAALLGNPSYPVPGANPSQAPRFPAAARGKFMVQSAGPDGYYLGNKDRGRKQVSVGWVDYEFNFVISAGGNYSDPNQQYHDKDGKATSIDVINAFDDLIVGSGN
jgi:prepilin-type N-terminal cleavage/methylation domain-containing protein